MINKKLLHIYFKDDLKTKEVNLNSAQEIISKLDCKVKCCKSLKELSESIYRQPKSIAVHIDIIRRHGELESFETAIDLVGLATTGIEYTPVV